MAKLTSNLYWEDGATIGVGFYLPWVPFPGVTNPATIDRQPDWFNPKEACVLIATNNREVWSYAVFPAYLREDERHLTHKSPYTYAPRTVRIQVMTKDLALKPEVAHLLKWAKSDMAKRCKHAPGHPDALVPGVAYEIKAPQIEDEEVAVVPGMEHHPDYGRVAYRGVPSKVYSRTRADIHRLVVDAIEAGSKAWGTWRPTGLEVQLHKSGSALGLAYAPGGGVTTGRTKISLNVLLFKQYDDNAIWRVIVHELCHHCHNEKYSYAPVPPEWQEAWKQHRQQKATERDIWKGQGLAKMLRGVSAALENIDSHPASFVYLLSKADPKVTVADFNKGIWFVESVDTALVSELRSKAEERDAKRAAAQARVTYSPAKGRIVAKTLGRTGRSRHILEWHPITKGEFPVTKFHLDMVYELASEIVRTGWADVTDAPHLGVIDYLSSVKVAYDPSWRGNYGRKDLDLFQMLAYLDKNRYSIYMPAAGWDRIKLFVEGHA